MKKVIYTALTGNYEPLLPAPKYPGWDSIAFVDNPKQKPNGWTLIHLPVDDMLGLVRTSRVPRMFPHKLLPQYDLSLYIDASIELSEDPTYWGDIDNILWLTSRHADREAVWEEFMANIKEKKVHYDTAKEQEKRYMDLGLHRECIPLTNNAVIMRKHNHPAVIETNEAWWEHFCEGTCRDQLSLPMALAETKLQITELSPRPKDTLRTPWWRIRHAGKHKEGYKSMPLYFLCYNWRGSAISRGEQIGKLLFDRGIRNEVVTPHHTIQNLHNATVVIVKEINHDHIKQLHAQKCKVIIDITDNAKRWEQEIKKLHQFISGLIFPHSKMERVWKARGCRLPNTNTVIHHHGDVRFIPNTAPMEPRAVCVSTKAQIPEGVRQCGIDCITEEGGWGNLFEEILPYNIHIAVYAPGADVRNKPCSKIVTAAACKANVILQTTVANRDLLPEYPYYIKNPEELPAMYDKIKRDYGSSTWYRGLELIEGVRLKTCGEAIAKDYDLYLSKF